MSRREEEGQGERLRPAPSERFAGDSRVFDLYAALTALRAEAHPAQSGHRQITLFHRAPVAQVLFAFESGGNLARHSTGGLVTIHVLEGRLRVQADGESHELTRGQVLILNPRVAHDVFALDASSMLLTVHLDEASPGRSQEGPE